MAAPCTHPEDKRESYHDNSVLCASCNCVIEQNGRPIDPPDPLGYPASLSSMMGVAAEAPEFEEEPSAWLITGSNIYVDTVAITKQQADRQIAKRGSKDSSYAVPLYRMKAPKA